jgi:integrase
VLASRPSLIQAWLRGLQDELADSHVRLVFAKLSAVLNAAVDDGLIVRNPCSARSVKQPRPDRRRVVPWTHEQVGGMLTALPARYRRLGVLGAGCGLRQGEAFGLAVDDVDFLGRLVHVRRQVRVLSGKLMFAPPKGGKERTVPLSASVALELAAHVEAFPPVAVTLPWRELTGPPVTARLLFTTPTGAAVNRNDFNARAWKPALAAAGIIPARERGEEFTAAREHGMHALRHYYASVLLDAGESIKALSEYLGHHDPGFPLRTYTHLMPASEERTRKAVDAALSAISETGCALNVPSGGI